MIIFWIAAALLSAGAAALVLRGAAAARPAGAEDPALAVHRRQLAELDDLAERGLLAESERKAARAEAGRRLLAAADTPAAPAEPAGKTTRLTVLIFAVAAPLLAAALYALFAGAPGAPDQPFAARIAAWQAHPEGLDWDQKQAIASYDVQRHPNDVAALKQLALASLFVGDGVSAEGAARRIVAAAPNDPEAYTLLAAAFARESGQVTPGARAALDRAVSLASALPPGDTVRDRIAGQVQGVYGIAAEAAGQSAAQTAGPQQAGDGRPTPEMIRGMVSRLAERLKTNPDDPQGWIMLVRAYSVIGDYPARDAALAAARERYADKPDILAELAKAKDAAQ